MAVVTYESNAIGNCKIRISAAKLPLAGPVPAGSRSEVFAKVSGSRRERTGIRARGFVWAKNAGTVEVPNMKYMFVPVLSLTGADTIPATAAYKGATWERGAFKSEDL